MNTHIFHLVMQSKVIPLSCMYDKEKKPLTDERLIMLLINIIKQIDKDRIEMSKNINDLEKYIFDKYGEIYESQK